MIHIHYYIIQSSPLLARVGEAREGSCFQWGLEYHGGGLDSPLETGVTSPDRCQLLCQARAGCKFFTWLSSQHEVPDYRNTCWLKSSQGQPQQCQTCVSGPRDCQEPPSTTSTTSTTSSYSDCCPTVTVASQGEAGDYQWTRLGVFSLMADLQSPDGRPVYMKPGSFPQYLYYLEWLGVWYVGDQPLVNMGGLINWGDALCPSQLQQFWSFYRWGDGEINDWDEDPLLTVTCGGSLPSTTTSRTTSRTSTETPETSTSLEEACSWGSGCSGCSVFTESGGVRYCCATDCDQGEVWVWQEDGQVRCACSHHGGH